MDLNKFALFRLMGQRMNWLSQRQQVLATNVANADTPGYRPSDLKPLDFQSVIRGKNDRLSVRATNAGHIQGKAGQSSFAQTTRSGSYQSALSGNSVVLEDQLMKVANTAMEYQVTTNLYRKHVAIIRSVLSGGGR